MSDSHYVNWKDFESHRLTLAGVVSKKSKADPAQNKPEAPYQQSDFNYLYKLPDGKEIKDTFCIELCSVKCYGIEVPHGQFKNYQIKAIFNKNELPVQECIKMLDVVHARMVDLICEPQMKLALKAKNIDAELAKKKGIVFKKLIYFHDDKATGEIDYDKNPNQYYKLNTYDSSKTKFTTMDETRKIIILEWSIMEKAEFSGIPLIKYSHVYSNSNNISPQCNVLSMAIEELKVKGSDNLQINTLNSIVEKKPDFPNSIAVGLANIREKMEQLSMKGPINANKIEPQRQPEPLTSTPTDITNFMRNGPTQTFAGAIAPQNQQFNQSQQPQNQQQFTQPQQQQSQNQQQFTQQQQQQSPQSSQIQPTSPIVPVNNQQPQQIQQQNMAPNFVPMQQVQVPQTQQGGAQQGFQPQFSIPPGALTNISNRVNN